MAEVSARDVSVTMRTEPTRVATVSNTSFPEITVAPPAGGAVERTAAGDDGLLNRAFDVPFAVGDIERRSRSRVA